MGAGAAQRAAVNYALEVGDGIVLSPTYDRPPCVRPGKSVKDWDEVAAFALGFPGTELSSSYGKPAVRVRGKAFVYPGRERGSFCVATPLEEKDMLMETDPDTFWEIAPLSRLAGGARPT